MAKRRGPAQASYFLAQEHSPSTQSGSSRQCWCPAEEADLKARFSPDAPQPSSLREPGAQDSAGPQAPQATKTGLGPANCHFWILSPSSRSGGDKERFSCFEVWAQPVDSHGQGSGALQDTALSLVPGPPAHSRLARGRAAWRALGRRPRPAFH